MAEEKERPGPLAPSLARKAVMRKASQRSMAVPEPQRRDSSKAPTNAAEPPKTNTVSPSKAKTSSPVKTIEGNPVRTTGIFKDYLSGLDHVREVVRTLDVELTGALNEFYECSETDEAKYNVHLRKVSDAFETCNSVLTKANKPRQVVQSQAQIAALINAVKAAATADTPVEAVECVAEFWEGSKITTESIQGITDRFRKNVLERLRASCGSYKAANQLTALNGLSLPSESKQHLTAPEDYSKDVASYLSQLEDGVNTLRLLAASYGNKLNLSLISKSSLLDRLLRGCDDESYPVLQVIPDLTVKLERLFQVTRQWLDRDETYVFELGKAIRDARSVTRKKEEEMKAEKDKQRDLIKSVKSAFLICQNSKRKIREIATELQKLEGQVVECMSEQMRMTDEKTKKENMAEFLEISITQTRRNYNLQMRRQKLTRQVKEIESYLNEMQNQVAELKMEINDKSNVKQDVETKHSMDSKSFENLKVEMEAFSKNVNQINTEISSLRVIVTELETIQTFKTSPEKVDEFFERPRSVKLAPSLKQKISLRRQLKSL